MPEFLDAALILLLLAVAGAFVRVARGPQPADRMMGAQLAGTGGIGILLLLAARMGEPAILDVALLLALLAAFASVAFVKGVLSGGTGDPETDG
ncbi:MAG: monovalent cation/H+ antiporter complex subunit F [Sphingomonadaceae bacterium]